MLKSNGIKALKYMVPYILLAFCIIVCTVVIIVEMSERKKDVKTVKCG